MPDEQHRNQLMWEYLTYFANMVGTTPENLTIVGITASFMVFMWWLGYRTFRKANKDSQDLIDAINRGDHDKARNMVGLKNIDQE
jgi:hypothetical protein